MIQLIRQDRVTASSVSAKSKAKATPVDGAALLAKLMAGLSTGGPK